VAEEHLVATGLGVRVAQVVTETRPCAMEFVGIQDAYAESGTPEELMKKYGLVSGNVVAAAKRVLSRK
jgi:transketolase